MTRSIHRTRAGFIAAGLALVAAGLTVHLAGGALPPSVRDVLGDALWAAMLFCWVSAVNPGAAATSRALVTFGLAAAVEAGQLARGPFLDAVRATRLGHLVLGSDFDPRDLLAYGLGIAAAALIERLIRRRLPS